LRSNGIGVKSHEYSAKRWEIDVTDNASFRHQLDTVLRTRDVQEVRNFLIAEKQWSEELPSDPEFAMWMMET
jgi:hypothetical protein